MQQLLEQGNIVTEDESKLALKLRSLKRSGQKIVEVQFTDSQDHLRGSARVKIEDLLYALVEEKHYCLLIATGMILVHVISLND